MLTELSLNHLLAIIGPMQSAGGEGGGEEGREESSCQEERDGKLQDGGDRAADDYGATVPPVQEVCFLMTMAMFLL